VTRAVQDTIENMVGKAALAKDGEHDGAQPCGPSTKYGLPGAFI